MDINAKSIQRIIKWKRKIKYRLIKETKRTWKYNKRIELLTKQVILNRI
jgi:hypothetical protein